MDANFFRPMDPLLKKAASTGNVSFLIQAIEDKKPTDYFLSLWTPTKTDESPAGNIFHLAALNRNIKFIEEALDRLPAQEVQILLSHPSPAQLKWNSLHVAVANDDYEVVKLILGFYKQLSNTPAPSPAHAVSEDPPHRPWLVRDEYGRAPSHLAIMRGNEECAMEIQVMDMELLCSAEFNGPRALYFAVEKGLERHALTILTCDFSYDVSSTDGYCSTLFCHVMSNCSENVGRLLLKKYSGLLDVTDEYGFSALHCWAKNGRVWPLKLLKEADFAAAKTTVFQEMINKQDGDGRNPLQVAIEHRHEEFARVLVCGYQHDGPYIAPLRTKDRNYGNTPLHLAIIYELEQLALFFLSIDAMLSQICNDEGESPLFLAVKYGCQLVVEEILSLHQDPPFNMLRRKDEHTVLHALANLTEQSDISKREKMGRLMVEKFWWLINFRDKERKTTIDLAKERGAPWLVRMLEEPSQIPRAPFNWIIACQRGELRAFMSFIEHCQDHHKLYRERKDSPLHHIKLPSYKQYQDFLKIPSIAELKNTPDFDHATPLHRALERKDMLLSKLLLTEHGVDRNIKDKRRNSAMDLLAKLCEQDAQWKEMCQNIGINPELKNLGPSAVEMRTTLSVVAALLATLTFAAGFTLPGGFNSDTGHAILARKASFVVFILADTYAMCCSMLVLFCLIWSMVCELDKSQVLIDRSVRIIIQSFYGTLVAFMTGVYTVIAQKSLWASIVVFVMCSLVAISATSRTILYQVLEKAFALLDKLFKVIRNLFFCCPVQMRYEDQSRSLEEGTALIESTSGNNSNAQRGSSTDPISTV